MPAFDSRYDCYTGDPDQVITGGAPTTLPGYGPTRGPSCGSRCRRETVPVNESGFTVQSSADNGTTWATLGTVSRPAPTLNANRSVNDAGLTTGGTVSFTDTTVVMGTTYVYRALANDLLGDTQRFASPAAGYQTLSVDSVPSAVSNQITPQSTSSGGGVADTATHRKSLSASSRGGGGDPSPSA